MPWWLRESGLTGRAAVKTAPCGFAFTVGPKPALRSLQPHPAAAVQSQGILAGFEALV